MAVPVAQTPPGEMTSTQRDVWAELKEDLNAWGLGGLAETVKTWVLGDKTQTEIVQLLRETPTYKTRFKAIIDREKKGLPPISPADVINFENSTKQIFMAAGLPKGFYDQPEDFVQFLVNDVSPVELQQRIDQSATRMRNAPPEIQAAFRDFFGNAEGDGVLTAVFADPDRAGELLPDLVDKAILRGTGKIFGVNISMGTMDQLHQQGVTESQAQQGFSELFELQSIFNESISESQDLAAETEGVQAIFKTGGSGGEQIRKRLEERQAALSGGGGAAGSQQGLGLGRAR